MKNGLMSSLPYVACALCTGVFAFLTEAIIRKQWLKRNSITKLFSSLGESHATLQLDMSRYFDSCGVVIVVVFFSFIYIRTADTDGRFDMHCVRHVL